MDEIEKSKILLNHWIEHNETHIKSYKEWAEKLKEMGYNEISQKIKEAADIILIVNEKFKQAEEMLKGK